LSSCFLCNVLPLDDRRIERFNADLAGRPQLVKGNSQLLFGGMGRLSENSVLVMKNKSFSLTAELEVPAKGAEGVIIHQGGAFGGMSLYTKAGKAKFAYNFLGLQTFTTEASQPIPAGKHQVRMEFAYDGGGFGKGGNVSLYYDGKKVGEGRVERTVPMVFSLDETTDVGRDTAAPVSSDYTRNTSVFNGKVHWVWAEVANWGFGEPRFVFYPPGSWMLGAALGSLLPWKVVPLFFVWLVLIGAGLSMFLLARESMPRQQAALAAMLFAANPYHLLLVYYRSDFAELLASAFFPLLLWGVMRIRPEQNFLFSRATSMAVNTDFNLKISCVVLLMGALIAVAAVHLAKSAAIPRLHY
jgi:hypothetical protein